MNIRTLKNDAIVLRRLYPGKKIGWFAAGMACISALALHGQTTQEYIQNDVIVTASRVPVVASDLTRSVTVLTAEDIRRAPVNSVQELLQYAGGVDVRQRGIAGTQADVSIRGGSFEQTLVLLDGVRVSDPQTAHHSMNVPVALLDIERVEILKGQGSHIYGPNAFSGVVNIITKKTTASRAEAQVTAGEHGYYNGMLALAYPIGPVGVRVSGSRQKADGDRYNTQFTNDNASAAVSFVMDSTVAHAFFGYDNKQFGANGFYSTRYPDQWEHTTTKLATADVQVSQGALILSAQVSWRRNDDDYMLNYRNPSFYRNIHRTNVYNADVQASLMTGLGTTVIGGQYMQDDISSTNLGNHSRYNKGVFIEQTFSPVENVVATLGGFAYDYATIGWKVWPGLEMAWKAADDLRILGSVGKAFRMPSYTDLYYQDPVTQGNADLTYEETLNYEVGAVYEQPAWRAEATVFAKQGSNIIDWVRSTDVELWAVRNVANVNTTGIEVNAGVYPVRLLDNFPIQAVTVSYTWLNSDKQTDGLLSRYVLDYLHHQVVLGINNDLPFGIQQRWAVRYVNRKSMDDYALVDTQIARRFSDFNIFLRAVNLFNTTYEEIPGAILPGRWIYAGVQVNMQGW